MRLQSLVLVGLLKQPLSQVIDVSISVHQLILDDVSHLKGVVECHIRFEVELGVLLVEDHCVDEHVFPIGAKRLRG